MSDYPACSVCGRENVTTMTITARNSKPTPPVCTDCFSKRTGAAIRGGLKGNGMSKRTTTTTKNGVRVNRKTGEALNNGRQQTFPVDQDLKKLEREIAHAYGELVDLKES